MWADDDVLKGPASWLHSKLPCVADMLASLVASRVTNITGVTDLALTMLTEFVWTAELAITAMTTVLADTTATTILTHAAFAPVRTDTTTTAVFTDAAFAPVLTDTTATTILTHAAFAPVITDTTATAIFTHTALTPMRTFVTLTFAFRTHVALQTCFQHLTESVHLEAVSKEALGASGTLDGIVHVLDCIHMH